MKYNKSFKMTPKSYGHLTQPLRIMGFSENYDGNQGVSQLDPTPWRASANWY